MRAQWEYKRKSFEVVHRTNRLIMTINDQMDRNDFRKDIPSHVIDDVRQDKVIMWVEEAQAFFGIPFSSPSQLKGLVKRILGSDEPPDRSWSVFAYASGQNKPF